MIRPNMSYDDIQRIARDGSPLVMQALGRLYGFSQGDFDQLRRSLLPTWVILLGVATAGFVAGVRVQKHYGHKLPKLIGGA